MTAEDRFWAKVERRGPDECWPWLAYRNPDGYGAFSRNPGRPERAHRIAYELLVGPIPEGLTIDHLCRNRACCNPAHLEPVTNRENVLRGESSAAERARRTHCPRGHELTPPNVRFDRQGHRYCQACRLVWYHANKHKRLDTGHRRRVVVADAP